MVGAIIGDIAGSYYEMHNIKSKKFKFMEKNKSEFTDDTVMTLAVYKSLLEANGNYDNLSQIVINNMVAIVRNHSQCGFGGDFFKWNEVKLITKIVTKVSHNHPEAIKAAESVSTSIFLAKTGAAKQEIKKYIKDNYYDINFTLNEIRESYSFNVTCQ